jgi:hypothetical protein
MSYLVSSVNRREGLVITETIDLRVVIIDYLAKQIDEVLLQLKEDLRGNQTIRSGLVSDSYTLNF